MSSTKSKTVTIILSLFVSTTAYGAPSQRFDVKLNPNPSIRYAITAGVEGIPGRFDRVEEVMNYRVDAPSCVPMTPVTGATVVPEKRVSFELRPADDAFAGTILIDLLKDEDCFGRGVCHWSVAGLTADLHHGAVNFSPGIGEENILRRREIVKYVSKRSYEQRGDERIDIGTKDPSAHNDPRATFSIRIRARSCS